MKSSVLRLLLAALAGAATAQAGIVFQTDFETWPPVPAAESTDPVTFGFHNAIWAPRLDAAGFELPGTEHWTIDWATDLYSPVGTANPADFGYGAAPSGSHALNALFGPVLLQFSQPLRLSAFSVVLDDSPFGDLGSSSIWFVSSHATIGRVDFDATIPLVNPTWDGGEPITGIVFQGGGFYDDLAFRGQPVPEPATWGLMGALACAGLAWWRRSGLGRKAA